MASVKKVYYKYFSLKIRNNEEFIKFALFKNDSYDIRFEDIYNAFSRKNKTKIKWVIDAMKNSISVDEQCLSKKLLDNDDLAEYCYNNDPYKLYHFSKRIRAKYPF